jgi:hypothetical protein
VVTILAACAGERLSIAIEIWDFGSRPRLTNLATHSTTAMSLRPMRRSGSIPERRRPAGEHPALPGSFGSSQRRSA